jgi:hypothetical protein
VARYKLNDGTTFQRKHLYLPCAVIDSSEFEQLSVDEQKRLLKDSRFLDSISASEWKAALKEDGFSPSARSRLKTKAAGWLAALNHVALNNPELFEEIAAKADALHQEQFGQEPVVRLVWDGRRFDVNEPLWVGVKENDPDGDRVVRAIPVDWHPEPEPVADPPQAVVEQEEEE